MRSVSVLALAAALASACAPPAAGPTPAREAPQPNIIFILADDLGYGDLGVYGQERIRTPRLDRMAAEGMRFTQFYAGSTVCAPSRSVLMTGQHTGHTTVRGNADIDIQRLDPDDVTVAQMLDGAGYATGLIGKWALGELGTPGHPNEKGFDYFFGYSHQSAAHNFYPEFLWRNDERVPLRNEVKLARGRDPALSMGVATKRVDYSHDLFAEEALEFVEEHRSEPFFLYLALTIPHANNEADDPDASPPEYVGMEVPDYGPYAERDWPATEKGFAAMITRMDADVGRLLDRLRELGIAEETLVIFSSDNGPHQEGGHDADFFDSNGPLRGIKRDLYEGGIRVPTIAWWPEHVPAGSVSDHVGYFGDFLATAAELAGVEPPRPHDGISLVPVLLGQEDRQREHEYLYWEFYERGSAQAVRAGRWKAVRKPIFTGEIELYDLETDIGERNDVAARHPEVVERARRMMEEAHVPDPRWQPRGQPVSTPAASSPAAAAAGDAGGFPGWARTDGGRGGRIVRVTNLASSGPGSFRAAVSEKGPRIVVFEVGGVIDLGMENIQITEPDLTVAGQTAPSPGITLIRGGMGITTHDVILQHIRVRPGEAAQGKKSGWEVDAIATGGPGAYDIVVDHVSTSWGTDENLSASGPRFGVDSTRNVQKWRQDTSHRITFSNNIIAEGLSESTHAKGEHSKGTLIHDNAADILIFGNLYASNVERHPLLKGGSHAAVVNNLIHNPGRRGIHYNLLAHEWEGFPYQTGQAVVVGNVLRYGPDTREDLALIGFRGHGDLELFAQGNLATDREGAKVELLESQPHTPDAEVTLLERPPFWPPGLDAMRADDVPEYVFANAGARPWDRDAVDQRIVREARERRGRIIDSEREVGGYPAVQPTRRAFDPEEWDLETMERRPGTPGY